MELSLVVSGLSFRIDKLHLRKQIHFIFEKLLDTEMLRTDISSLQDLWRMGWYVYFVALCFVCLPEKQ